MSEDKTTNEPAATDPPAATPQPSPVTKLLLDRFGGSVLRHDTTLAEETVVIQRQGMLDVFSFLRDDPACAFNLMIDVSAVDYQPRSPRFEVVVHLKSMAHNHRLRVKVPVEESAPEVDSIHALWVAADWYERECHEMYGIVFKGHPNLKPLLLYDGFEGHPLRKDYPKGLQQPLVPMRPIKERYDYGERFQPVQRTRFAAAQPTPEL